MVCSCHFAVLGQIVSCKNIAVSQDNTIEMTALLDFRTVTSSQFYAHVPAVRIFKNKALFQFEDPLHVKICFVDKKYRTKKISNFYIILFYM
jgi:hypothetical protein